MQQLIRNLIDSGYLKSPEIIAAFEKIDRADFVPSEVKELAYENVALPIGYGQTISQPQVVAFMLELLAPRKGENILDIGSGSGWQTALIAEIVGDGGKVTAVERVPEVFEFGRENLGKYGFKNIDLMSGDGTQLLKPEGYFDKIIAAASGKKLPENLQRELKTGGKIVIPIGDSIFVFTKGSQGKLSAKEYPGFLFVPLISD